MFIHIQMLVYIVVLDGDRVLRSRSASCINNNRSIDFSFVSPYSPWWHTAHTRTKRLPRAHYLVFYNNEMQLEKIVKQYSKNINI